MNYPYCYEKSNNVFHYLEGTKVSNKNNHIKLRMKNEENCINYISKKLFFPGKKRKNEEIELHNDESRNLK